MEKNQIIDIIKKHSSRGVDRYLHETNWEECVKEIINENNKI